MKNTILLLLITLALSTGCRNSANTNKEQTDIQNKKIETLTTEMEEVNKEIDKKTEELEKALKDLDENQ